MQCPRCRYQLDVYYLSAMELRERVLTITYRDAKIAADYVAGAPVQQLAKEHSVSNARIYQLIGKVFYRSGMTGKDAEENPSTFVLRLAALQLVNRVEPDTPEAFYWQVALEQRRFTVTEDATGETTAVLKAA